MFWTRVAVALAAAVLLALSAQRFSFSNAVPITGLVVACGGLLVLARRRRKGGWTSGDATRTRRLRSQRLPNKSRFMS